MSDTPPAPACMAVALIIAAEKFDKQKISNWAELANAVGPARKLARAFRRSGVHVWKELYNAEATIENVLRAIKGLYAFAQEQNVGQVMIYFSGHGSSEAHWALHDGKLHITRGLFQDLESRYRARHTVIINDCCYSKNLVLPSLADLRSDPLAPLAPLKDTDIPQPAQAPVESVSARLHVQSDFCHDEADAEAAVPGSKAFTAEEKVANRDFACDRTQLKESMEWLGTNSRDLHYWDHHSVELIVMLNEIAYDTPQYTIASYLTSYLTNGKMFKQVCHTRKPYITLNEFCASLTRYITKNNDESEVAIRLVPWLSHTDVSNKELGHFVWFDTRSRPYRVYDAEIAPLVRVGLQQHLLLHSSAEIPRMHYPISDSVNRDMEAFVPAGAQTALGPLFAGSSDPLSILFNARRGSEPRKVLEWMVWQDSVQRRFHHEPGRYVSIYWISLRHMPSQNIIPTLVEWLKGHLGQASGAKCGASELKAAVLALPHTPLLVFEGVSGTHIDTLNEVRQALADAGRVAVVAVVAATDSVLDATDLAKAKDYTLIEFKRSEDEQQAYMAKRLENLTPPAKTIAALVKAANLDHQKISLLVQAKQARPSLTWKEMEVLAGQEVTVIARSQLSPAELKFLTGEPLETPLNPVVESRLRRKLAELQLTVSPALEGARAADRPATSSTPAPAAKKPAAPGGTRKIPPSIGKAGPGPQHHPPPGAPKAIARRLTESAPAPTTQTEPLRARGTSTSTLVSSPIQQGGATEPALTEVPPGRPNPRPSATSATTLSDAFQVFVGLTHARSLRSIYPPFEEFPLCDAQQKALEAIRASPGDLRPVALFASTIPRYQTIAYMSLDGLTRASRMGILADIVQVAPRLALAYRLLSEGLYNFTELTPAGFPKQIRNLNRMALLERAHRLDPDDPHIRARMALATRDLSRKEDLAFSALRIDQTCSLAFLALELLCPPNDLMKIPRGYEHLTECGTEKDFIHEAIKFDPNNAEAFVRLGILSPGGQVRIGDRQMSQKDLFIEAIRVDPSSGPAYKALGVLLAVGELITVNSRSFSARDCFIEAIRLNPTISEAYYELGRCLPADGRVEIGDGRTMTQQELFNEAIKLNPSYVQAYHALGRGLPSGGKVKLSDGTTLTQRELFLRAIELDPRFSPAYASLGALAPVASFSIFGLPVLSSGDRFSLPDGRAMTRQELLVEAIHLDPTNWTAYSELGRIITPGERIQLKDGRKLSQEELLAQGRRTTVRPRSSTLHR